MKNKHFHDAAFIEPERAGIPFSRKKEMLVDFFAKNNVVPERRNEFMEKVVAPWASQSMIAHIMATDFDSMNDHVSLKKEVPSQDFEQMRSKLPIERQH